MLVRIDPRKRPEDFGEMELLRVRGLFPDQTLYTLQVEVWSDFGSGELSAEQVREQAEEACARLRRVRSCASDSRTGCAHAPSFEDCAEVSS